MGKTPKRLGYRITVVEKLVSQETPQVLVEK